MSMKRAALSGLSQHNWKKQFSSAFAYLLNCRTFPQFPSGVRIQTFSVKIGMNLLGFQDGSGVYFQMLRGQQGQWHTQESDVRIH